MKTAPLPCPFCGEKTVLVVQGGSFRWRLAQCGHCGAQGPEVRCQTTGTGNLSQWEVDAAERAVCDWNERARPAGESSPALHAALLDVIRAIANNPSPPVRWGVEHDPRRSVERAGRCGRGKGNAMSDEDLQRVIDNLLALNKRYPTPIISDAIHAIAYLQEDRRKRLEYAEGIRHIRGGTL